MKNNEESVEEQLDHIAKEVARRYASRCWWADLADLQQQAWVVVLEVYRCNPPLLDSGDLDRDRLGSFAWVAAMRQLSRYLWRQSAPVSATDHEIKQLSGIHHCQLDLQVPDQSGDPEYLFHQFEVRERIRHRILELCGYVQEDAWMLAVLKILMDGEKPGTASTELGLPSYGVYRMTEWVKFRINGDEKLLELVSELSERSL